MHSTSAHPKRRLEWWLGLIPMMAFTVLVLPTSTIGAQGHAPAGDPRNGKTVYLRVGCHRCHGTMGQGGFGGRLAPNTIPAPVFTIYVRKGKRHPDDDPNWSGMPPYSEKFISDSELADIYAYLASIPPPAPVESIPLLSP